MFILLAGTCTGAITDAKTGYIYDWITIPMIVLGILISLLSGSWTNILVAIGLFIVLYGAYYFGKIGGGDVKLFVGIALLNPFNDFLFLVGIMFIAGISSLLFYSIYYLTKYFLKKKGKIKIPNKKNLWKTILLFGMLIIYFYFGMAAGFFDLTTILFIGLPLIAGLLFFMLQDEIKKEFFEKRISLEKLEEDEVISMNSNTQKILDLFKTKQIIGELEIIKLKKMKIKSVVVLRKLPAFGPFIFIGVLISILFNGFLWAII